MKKRLIKYKTIVSDPPWPIGDRLPGPKRGSAKHYKLLSLSDIMRFQLPPLADDARLFLWRLASMQEEALQVMRAWSFTPKAEIVWVKTTKHLKTWFGMGRQVRMSHEVCLIGVRGRPKRSSASVRSVIVAPHIRHSQKPEEFYDAVEELSPGPYVDLFARRKRKGWLCLGAEVK